MPDDYISRADLETLVGIQEVQEMLSRGRRKVVARSYAMRMTRRPGFPAPLVIYPHPVTGRRPHTRLWLVADVEAWMRRNVHSWADLPPAPPQ